MFSFKFEPESEWFGTVKCVQSASRSLVLPYVALPLCRPNPERSRIYCFIVCVCVLFYYTPISSAARGVPYLLQGMLSFLAHS